MERLRESIQKEFEECGHWVIQKIIRRFSAMPIDQTLEQNNEVVKSTGGAVGLIENPSTFRKWMISAPEQARILKEFEGEYFYSDSESDAHHEEGFSAQKNFKEQTNSLIHVFNELGNLFLDNSNELLTLDTRNILDESVISTVRNIQNMGKEQYAQYCKDVIIKCTRSIHDPIKKLSQRKESN